MAKKTRFHGPATVALVTATKYTVPAGQRAIVRHIHVSNPTAAAVTFTLSIGADAAGARIFGAYPIAANTVLDHFCYYVLEAAEIIAANAGTDIVITLTIDGDVDLV